MDKEWALNNKATGVEVLAVITGGDHLTPLRIAQDARESLLLQYRYNTRYGAVKYHQETPDLRIENLTDYERDCLYENGYAVLCNYPGREPCINWAPVQDFHLHEVIGIGTLLSWILNDWPRIKACISGIIGGAPYGSQKLPIVGNIVCQYLGEVLTECLRHKLFYDTYAYASEDRFKIGDFCIKWGSRYPTRNRYLHLNLNCLQPEFRVDPKMWEMLQACFPLEAFTRITFPFFETEEAAQRSLLP